MLITDLHVLAIHNHTRKQPLFSSCDDIFVLKQNYPEARAIL